MSLFLEVLMEIYRSFADDYKLLGDYNRLRILKLLDIQECCVCEVVDYLGLSQPLVSQHLRKLKTAGWVDESRRGQWVYYRLTLEQAHHIHLRTALELIPSMEPVIEAKKVNGYTSPCERIVKDGI
jgi:ArsR family transcriptional regulator